MEEEFQIPQEELFEESSLLTVHKTEAIEKALSLREEEDMAEEANEEALFDPFKVE